MCLWYTVFVTTPTTLQQPIDSQPDLQAQAGGTTQAEQAGYLSALASLGDSLSARLQVKLDRGLLTGWRRDDLHGFRQREAEAKEDYGDGLEQQLHKLIELNMRPGGNPTPLLTRLKAERPSKYSKDAEPLGVTQAAELLAALRAPGKRPAAESPVLPSAIADLTGP